MKKQIEQRSKDLKLATKRATKKTLKWFQSQVIKLCVAELGIKRSTFKSRWFIDTAKNSLWMGLNPLPVHRLGKARQNKTGVYVGGEQHDHAFLMNKTLVFERVGAARLPIEMITKEVKEDVLFAFNQVKPLALARFKTILKQELNFVRINKKY